MTEISSHNRRATALMSRFLSGLRYPWIFGLVGFFFVVDLIVPDVVPFADEVLLGLLTLLLAAWRKRKDSTSDQASVATAEPRALPPTSMDNPEEPNQQDSSASRQIEV